MMRLSLRTKVLSSVGCIIFIVLGMSTFLHIEELRHAYFEAFEWRADALVQNLLLDALSFKKYKKFYDYSANVQRMLGKLSPRCHNLYSLYKDKGLTHFAVINAEGTIVSHNALQFLNTPVESQALLQHLPTNEQIIVRDGEIYHALVPIISPDGEYLGAVDIGIAGHIIRDEIRSLLLRSFGLFAASVVLAFFPVSLFVHLFLTKPIFKLAESSSAIADGNLEQTIDTSGRDEIGTLARSFLRMRDAIREKISALQTLNQELDLRVEERTADLADAYEKIRGLNEQLEDENVAMRTEMDLARRIQTAILPSELQHEALAIEAVMIPAEEVGGDYYDVLYDEDGHLWLGIGDVSGHGVTPGLIMMMAQTIKTTVVSNRNCSPRDVVIMVNKILFKNVQERLGEDHFMTFSSLKYLGQGRFQHAGAHLDMIVHRRASDACELVDTDGAWLNLIQDIAPATNNAEFTLEIGDTLVLYTDGLTEAHTPRGEILDIQRFLDIVQKHVSKAPAVMRDAILEDVLAWCEDHRSDDMSLVIVRRMK